MTMPVMDEGTVLWEPSAERIRAATISAFMDWLRTDRGVEAEDYAALHRWSVDEVEQFWAAIRRYFGVGSDTGSEPVLVRGNGAEHAGGSRTSAELRRPPPRPPRRRRSRHRLGRGTPSRLASPTASCGPRRGRWHAPWWGWE